MSKNQTRLFHQRNTAWWYQQRLPHKRPGKRNVVVAKNPKRSPFLPQIVCLNFPWFIYSYGCCVCQNQCFYFCCAGAHILNTTWQNKTKRFDGGWKVCVEVEKPFVFFLLYCVWLVNYFATIKRSSIVSLKEQKMSTQCGEIINFLYASSLASIFSAKTNLIKHSVFRVPRFWLA